MGFRFFVRLSAANRWITSKDSLIFPGCQAAQGSQGLAPICHHKNPCECCRRDEVSERQELFPKGEYRHRGPVEEELHNECVHDCKPQVRQLAESREEVGRQPAEVNAYADGELDP
eukprot:CAMPEP_0195651888 /NCGR_PEP_ID=MMETSP0815-20121206/32521_1 /TAXON_ID=97485 /ORGANISM="Prymnesium parvum, Strain Texoma1" /LENGTH=115 /DNA_ID=CAMNT_0040795851 /DNA_START=173 /DNA_END=520 /DNA_ORIENTATION=-